MTKTALILGITGGFGKAMAHAMARHGWQLRALMRDPGKLDPALRTSVDVIKGDANHAASMREAMRNCEIVVYGINIPYQHWDKQALPLLETCLQAMKEIPARLVFPGNIYAFDPTDRARIQEDSRQNAPTEKGRIRARMENRLRQATKEGTQVLILRAGDYFGTESTSSWMQEIVKSHANGVILTKPASDDHLHAFCFLPDLAETACLLLKTDLHAWDVFHFRGHEASMQDIEHSLIRLVGHARLKTRKLPWLAIRILGVISPMMREVWKMRYLWQQTLLLDDQKLQNALPSMPHTPLDQAIAACLPQEMQMAPNTKRPLAA